MPYGGPVTTPDTDVLLTRAQSWLAEDPDEHTRDELIRVIAAVEAGDADAGADLADRFRGTLEFGTAGLRGALGAGPNRMNRIVVIRAAAGLAAYLLDTGTTPGTPVVIGYDARHKSDVFARDTAEVMAGAGLKPLLLPRPLPTPLLAFAIRELGCAAGVMVTASHNPPQDNGYKVYLGDGSQIVPPADSEIAARIAAVGSLESVPRVPLESTGGRVLDDGIVDSYLDTVAGLAGDGPRDLAIVYTPLHGVGGGALPTVLENAGFATPQVVAEQEAPDPDFPTVAFPNPRSPAPSTAPSPSPSGPARTSSSPTTPTRTAAPRRCRMPAPAAGGCCAATRSARCWPTICSAPAARASTPRRSCRPRCSGRWPRRTGSGTPRR